MKLVVDASVAIKWVVEEEDRDTARQIVADGHHLLGPDFLLVETSNVLWKKVRRNELSEAQALAAARNVLLPFREFIATNRIARRALEIGLRLDHPIYDCLYLATAELLDARMVTADARLLAAVRDTELAAMTIHMADVANQRG